MSEQLSFRFEYHFTMEEVCDGAFLRQRGLLAQLPTTVAWFDYEQYWRWREG